MSVPLQRAVGEMEGTLCGASSRRVKLGPSAREVMETFAAIIATAAEKDSSGAQAPLAPQQATPANSGRPLRDRRGWLAARLDPAAGAG